MTLWVVRCGGDSAFEQEAYEQNIVGIGWGKLGDVSKYENIEELRSHYSDEYPDASRGNLINCSSQVFAFSKKIQIGDFVALPLRSQRTIAFGKIIGDYAFVKNAHQYVAHQRKVEWINKPIPRDSLPQDLLYILGAFLTIFQVTRNDAEKRLLGILNGNKDTHQNASSSISESIEPSDEPVDIEAFSREQIMQMISSKFSGHAFSRLIGEILKAQGFRVHISPEGPDGGVDVLAGSGPSGFENPRIAVQVKSGSIVVDAPTIHNLQGTMSNFNASHGLIVSWGGFNSAAKKEARRLFFTLQTWDSDDVFRHLTENYDLLSEEIKAELPLKRIWSVVRPENS